jgi:hypothetical protein
MQCQTVSLCTAAHAGDSVRTSTLPLEVLTCIMGEVLSPIVRKILLERPPSNLDDGRNQALLVQPLEPILRFCLPLDKPLSPKLLVSIPFLVPAWSSSITQTIEIFSHLPVPQATPFTSYVSHWRAVSKVSGFPPPNDAILFPCHHVRTRYGLHLHPPPPQKCQCAKGELLAP